MGAISKLRIKDITQMMTSSEYSLYTILEFTSLTCYEGAKLLLKQGKFAWAMISGLQPGFF